jgi:hypothetical protein
MRYDFLSLFVFAIIFLPSTFCTREKTVRRDKGDPFHLRWLPRIVVPWTFFTIPSTSVYHQTKQIKNRQMIKERTYTDADIVDKTCFLLF